MRLFTYLKYFFYISINWNIIIAFYIIFHEIKGERKYVIKTIGIDNLNSLDDEQIEHATIYMPVVYAVIEKVFLQINISKINHLLDIGCGKGRAICVAAAKGCKQVSGIDISKALCMDALQNLTVIQQQHPALLAKVILKDAFQYEIPQDVDCIFLFNPFDEFLMEGVVKNIKKSIALHPRKMTVIYANPIYKSLFTDTGFKETFYYKSMKYIEVSSFEG